MNNTSNRHISISPNSRRNANALNVNSSSPPSKTLKKNLNNLNPQLSKKKEESNNKTLPAQPQQNSQQNKKSLKRTQQSKLALNQSTSTNTIQIPKSTPKINTSTNNQPTIQTNTLLQPITIINNNINNSTPIPTTNSMQPNQFPIIPMLDFSNLPSFESEPEFQRCPPVPRAIAHRGPRSGPPLETPIIVPLHIFNTPRLPCDVKGLWCDYTVSSTDKSSQLCCTICLCDFNEGEKAAKLKCGHVFHRNCIHSWINKGPSRPICPMCRQRLHKFVLDN